jgi:hypothetical protein
MEYVLRTEYVSVFWRGVVTGYIGLIDLVDH